MPPSPRRAEPPVAIESPRSSFVRMRAPSDPALDWLRREAEAARFLDDIAERHLALSVDLVCLEHAAGAMPYDRAARAAAATLHARIHEIGDVRDALEEVQRHAAERPELMPLFAANAPLSAYLAGVYVWLGIVVPALTQLAEDLRRLQPDWGTMRGKLEGASTWYFDGLHAEIRAYVARLDAGTALETRVAFLEDLEELFFSASWLHEKLAQRFG